MWIFTTGGFVSAVEHRDDSTKVMVRARDKMSLETMVNSVKEGLVSGGKADEAEAIAESLKVYAVFGDYKWRVVMPKSMFAVFLVNEVMEYINYANFKTKLTATRGKKWHDVAMNIWTAALKLTDNVKTGVDEIDNPKPFSWTENGYAGYHRDYPTAKDFVGSTFLTAADPEDEPTDSELIRLEELDNFIDEDGWEAYDLDRDYNINTGEYRPRPYKHEALMSLTQSEFEQLTDEQYNMLTEHGF